MAPSGTALCGIFGCFKTTENKAEHQSLPERTTQHASENPARDAFFSRVSGEAWFSRKSRKFDQLLDEAKDVKVKDQGHIDPLGPLTPQLLDVSSPAEASQSGDSTLPIVQPLAERTSGHVSAVNLIELQQHASIAELQKQESALRAILDHADKLSHAKQSLPMPVTGSTTTRLHNADVSQLKEKLLKCCAVNPGPEVFEHAAQLVAGLRSWLEASPAQGSAVLLLHGAGSALASSEHLARSAGPVASWPPQAVHLLANLMQTYTCLMEQCAMPRPSSSTSSFPPGGLASTLVQLLIRPDLLDLLIEVLELVHFNTDFQMQSQGRAGTTQDAVRLWDFLRCLVRFADTHSVLAGDKRLGECMQRMAHLLSPNTGAIPRLLQPLSADNLATQLPVLHLLQQLFDAPRNVVEQLLQPVAGPCWNMDNASSSTIDTASFYVAHHFREAARCYYAAGGDADSVCAELAHMHLLLVHSLVHSGAAAVLRAAHALGVIDLLLSEVALEADLEAGLEAGRQAQQVEEHCSSSEDEVSDSSDLDDDDAAHCRDKEPMPRHARLQPSKPGDKFEFSYDLNEDLERILELEDQLGKAIEVDGFEYDDEGKQLLQRSAALTEAAAKLPRVPDAARPAIPKLSLSTMSRSAMSSGKGSAGGALSNKSGTGAAAGATTVIAAPGPEADPCSSVRSGALRGCHSDGGASLLPEKSTRAAPAFTPRRQGQDSSRSILDNLQSARTPAAACEPSICVDDIAVSEAIPARPAVLARMTPVPTLDLSGLGGMGSRSRTATHRTADQSSGQRTVGTSGRTGLFPAQFRSEGGAGALGAMSADSSFIGGDCPLQPLQQAGNNDSKQEQQQQEQAPMQPMTSQRLLQSDRKLHLLLLRLALDLVLSPQGALSPGYWHQYPLDNGMPFNMEHLLMWHLNSGSGAALVGELQSALEPSSRGAGSQPLPAPLRLLRLLKKGALDESKYTELKFHARGAFGTIFRAKKLTQTGGSQQVMIKAIELPSSSYDRCMLPDVYGEVLVLERYKGCPGICQLIDYGLAGDAYWIVMHRYRCSLAEWRLKQKLGPASSAAAHMYLSILLQVVAALEHLAKDSVVHFDLKCSNVLLNPLPGVTDTLLWTPLGNSAPAQAAAQASQPACTAAAASPAGPSVPFQVVLADFGEARSYRSAEEAFTVRNRGTEVYKSPEMLLLNQRIGMMPDVEPAASSSASAQPVPPAAAAAAKAALSGAGLASDIWSLGCLAYELLSGQVLFGGDYASVTHRVAFGGEDNLRLNDAERAALGGRPELVQLVEWVLARDPAKRPSLKGIEERVRALQRQLL